MFVIVHFFFKTLSKGRWIRGIRISKYRSLKSKINRLKTFPNNFQSNSENFLFVRTIENDTHDNTINNRNWKKSGKRMGKYRKEILIFPTLFLFLILSRYFFLFLYPPIHVLLLLLPPSHSSSLFYILSVSLKRPSPAGV